MTKWYHGGACGLEDGRWILPPMATGVESMADGGVVLCDRTRVYVTSFIGVAAMYAIWRCGALYEVIPLGEILPDLQRAHPDRIVRCSAAWITRRIPLDRKLTRKAVLTLNSRKWMWKQSELNRKIGAMLRAHEAAILDEQLEISWQEFLSKERLHRADMCRYPILQIARRAES